MNEATESRPGVIRFSIEQLLKTLVAALLVPAALLIGLAVTLRVALRAVVLALTPPPRRDRVRPAAWPGGTARPASGSARRTSR